MTGIIITTTTTWIACELFSVSAWTIQTIIHNHKINGFVIMGCTICVLSYNFIFQVIISSYNYKMISKVEQEN